MKIMKISVSLQKYDGILFVFCCSSFHPVYSLWSCLAFGFPFHGLVSFAFGCWMVFGFFFF